jgi:excisionase family DNA binding protein
VAARFLTVDDVAERLCCSVRTVHARVARSEIPFRRLPGCRRLLFDEDDIAAWANGAELEGIELRGGGQIVRPKAA